MKSSASVTVPALAVSIASPGIVGAVPHRASRHAAIPMTTGWQRYRCRRRKPALLGGQHAEILLNRSKQCAIGEASGKRQP
jgi:hypothetical protein